MAAAARPSGGSRPRTLASDDLGMRPIGSDLLVLAVCALYELPLCEDAGELNHRVSFGHIELS